MDSKQPKKLIILYVLKILQECTDENHKISQHRIQELLEEKFSIKVDRKTIRSNLSMLMEFRYPIYYREESRINKNGEEETVLTDWYYEQEWTDGELKILINSLLFSSSLPKKHCIDIVEKIERLGNNYYKSSAKRIKMHLGERHCSWEMINTIEMIDCAIEADKKIIFQYNHYGTDCKIHTNNDDKGNVKEYIVSPFHMLSANGRHYLLCNRDGYDDLSHFRLDRMTDVRVSDSGAIQLRNLKGFENGLTLSEYLSQHPNLWSGSPTAVVFRCPDYLIGDVIDFFGTNIRSKQEKSGQLEIRVTVSEGSMLHWVIQFAESVEVISPESLRLRIVNTLREALKKYE